MSDLDGLRVALVAGTLGQGGAERQLFFVARTLLAAGARPRVLSLTRGGHWEAPLRDGGVPVEWVGERPGRTARLLAVTRAAARHQADLVQSFHFFTNPYAAVAARWLRRPDLGAIRNSGQADMDSVGGGLAQLCLRLPRLLVANSEAAIERLREVGVPASRLRLLPNAVDIAAFGPPTSRDGSGPFVVVAIGRLVTAKRFDRALRAIAGARARTRREIRLIIAGSGSEQPAIEALTAALGLAGSVTLPGSVADVRALLREADCLLLTSDHEGTPNVILEAMASARPVVATDVGGVGALVETGQTGLLVPRDDEERLAEAIVRLAEAPTVAACLGQRGRARVEAHFSLSRLEQNLRTLYREVLPGGARDRAPGNVR